jgi:large subunit ribosomal protein L47
MSRRRNSVTVTRESDKTIIGSNMLSLRAGIRRVVMGRGVMGTEMAGAVAANPNHIWSRNDETRGFASTSGSTTFAASPLDAFMDPAAYEVRQAEMVGRSWSVRELRRKSFDDLHRLWFVLYQERNMLLTEAAKCRRKGMYLPQPDRRHKVKKSMGAIKHVLGERKRDKIAQHALKRLEMQDDSSFSDDEDDDEEEEEPSTNKK